MRSPVSSSGGTPGGWFALYVGGHEAADVIRADIVRALSMAATVPTLDTERIRDANVRYHDAAARGYDSKWAIDYGEIGARPGAGQAREGARPAPGRYARALEIGAGTGYFSSTCCARA